MACEYVESIGLSNLQELLLELHKALLDTCIAGRHGLGLDLGLHLGFGSLCQGSVNMLGLARLVLELGVNLRQLASTYR